MSTLTYGEALDATMESIARQSVDLRDSDDDREISPHRPEVQIWAEHEEAQCRVSVSIGALWGQQGRFLELSPNEAREMARKLTAVADAIDEATA